MGKPITNEQKFFDVSIAGKNMLKYVLNPEINNSSGTISGDTQSGAVTYFGAHLITFNSGSSILDCFNTLIINSNYITTQINAYYRQLDKIKELVKSLNFNPATDTIIPAELQTEINVLNNTPLHWFKIIPSIQIDEYDSIRGINAKTITYNIVSYKVYNARSISISNGNPITDNRVVKEYDYIFTGKNTEILSFDLNFNNAFLTYAQFNHNAKIHATGAPMPANTDESITPSILSTIGSPITNGQSKMFVPYSNKSAIGVGGITPDRSHAADIVSTLYAPAEQILLTLQIYGDPDYIQQDGIFINPVTTNAFLIPTASNPVRGILFNNGEIYATITFKIPQDINLETGLLDLSFQGNSTNYYRNVFSGLYRIVTVENKFDRALFTQQVTMYRYDDSHHNTLSSLQKITNNSTTQTYQSEIQTAEEQLNKTAGIQNNLPSEPPKPVKDYVPPFVP